MSTTRALATSTTTSAMASASCLPSDGIPDLAALPIPHGVRVIVTTGTTANDTTAMVACCYPNSVGIALGCYEWCETNISVTAFGDCLTVNGHNASFGMESGTSAGHATAPMVSVTTLGLGALLVSSLILFA